MPQNPVAKGYVRVERHHSEAFRMSWAQIQTLTRVFLAGSCFLLVLGDEKTVEYPPVLEGSTVTLSCSGNTTSTDRNVIWNQYIKSKNKFKPLLSFKPNGTNWKQEQGYNATIISTGNTFSSNFTIGNLTRQSHANERFVCLVVDKSTNYSFVVASWNFSSIIRNPSSVNCSASVFLPNKLNVTCLVVNIFPNVFCQFYELYDQEENLVGKWNDSSIKVLLQSRTSDGDLSAKCSVVRPMERSGKYNYRIRVLPDLRLLNNTDIHIREATTEVTFKPEAILHLEQLCSVPLVIRYRCTGWWIPENLKVQWYQDEKLSPGSEDSFQYKGGFFKIISSMTIYNVRNQKSEIYCKIRLPNLELKSNKVNLEQYWQMSMEPFLISNGVRLMGNKLLQEHPNYKLECHVEVDPQRVQILSINCTSKDTSASVTASSSRKNTTWASFRNLSEFEMLDICYCSVLFENNCVLTTQLMMQPRSGDLDYWHSFSKIHLISYVVAACVLLVVFVTAGFLKSKWSSIYKYVYNTVHSKPSREPRDVHNELYTTVNSVHVSSASLGNSQELHNITRV